MLKTLSLIISVFFLMVMATAIPVTIGIGGWGPTAQVTGATVQRLYVDFESKSKDGSESAYMVGTDKGVFEVDNGFLLSVWNADELYAKLQVGKTYNFVTKGKKVANIFFQEYPYIVHAEAVPVLTIVPQDHPVELVTVRPAGEFTFNDLQPTGEFTYDLRPTNTLPLKVILPDGTELTFKPGVK